MSRTFSAMKKLFTRKYRQFAVRVGASPNVSRWTISVSGSSKARLLNALTKFERLARPGADEHALAGPDFFNRVRHGKNLRLVGLLPVRVV